MTLRLLTAPSVEPITLAQARMHLRLTALGSPAAHPEDDLVTALIAAARQAVENHTHRALCTQQWVLELDAWPKGGEIVLQKPPLIAVDGITYVDEAGDTQTLDTSLYQVVRPTGPTADRGSVIPAYLAVLPTMRCYPGSLQVTFTAGYGTGGSPDDSQAAVPDAIKAALKLQLAHLYENRGSTDADMPGAIRNLLSPFVSTVFP